MSSGFELNEVPWQPLAHFGLTNPFFDLNKTTLVSTWIILGLLVPLILVARWYLKKRGSILYHLTLSLMGSFIGLCEQSLGEVPFKHLVFVTAIFIFIFSSNLFALIPGIEEPTKDINTTLALGITAFTYIQVYSIKTIGLWGYIKGYLSPFFLMAPINIVGKLATVVSLSFRLFGNIFGGFIITTIYLGVIKGNVLTETVGMLSGIDLLLKAFFGLFEGFLQAFVFSMLTLTYLAIALSGEGGH
jgi:F-type H+-transporting ATPase subunit a